MTKSLGWKIFAIIFAGFVLATIVAPAAGDVDKPFEIFSVTLSVPVAIGLLLYAFGGRSFYLPFWTVVAWIYAAESVFAITMFVVNLVGTPGRFAASPVGALGAVAILVALQYFSWLGLHRYANRSVQPLSLRA